MKETSLKDIKEVTKSLIYIGIDNKDEFGFIPNPFISNVIDFVDGELIDITKNTNLNKWANYIREKIDKTEKLCLIYMLIRKPYKLTWLKLCKDFLSKKDFSKLLADAWINEENPNMNINVPITELIKWFKTADKKSLMVEEDFKVFENCPEIIHLYRGISSKGVKRGLSWTNDKEKAIWFRDRFESEGEILELDVKKEDILCYFNTRGEMEYVVDIRKYDI